MEEENICTRSRTDKVHGKERGYVSKKHTDAQCTYKPSQTYRNVEKREIRMLYNENCGSTCVRVKEELKCIGWFADFFSLKSG